MKIIKLFSEFFYYTFYYREYIKQSVARDLRKKYKRSYLGYVWSMLNPLFMMLVLAIVFSKLMNHIDNYAVFLFCGLLPWSYFDQTLNGSLNTIRQNAKIIDQVSIPKFIFPTTTAIYNFVNLFISIVPLLIVMLYTDFPLHLTMLAFPIILIPLFFVSMGLSLIFAVANVFFEDTQHLASILLRILYFLSPVLYNRDLLPDQLIDLRWPMINPMFSIIEMMRGLFYDGVLPSMETYFTSLATCTLILGFGLWLFKKTEQKFLYFI